MSKKSRSLLSQLRCGILPLRLETGRFQNIRDSVSGNYRKLKVEERICLICDDNCVEDEIHFVCSCDAYCIPREKLYREINAKNELFCQMDDRQKFIYTLNNEAKLISIYITEAWTIRTSLLFNEN